MERRLSAVLAFDMVGYSRLMGLDERGTLEASRRHRSELFYPRAAQYHGRIIKFMGDGALLEFASVVEAVCFAVEVQLALRAENEGIPEERQYRYRIGINIGDIVPDEGDIYGDGVNVAARLEQLAAPGEIYLSGSAFEQVKGKLDLDFEHLGDKHVKNIAEPVTVYQVRLDARAAAMVTPVVPLPPARRRHRSLIAAAAAAFFALLAGWVLWVQPWNPVAATPPVERVAYPLPDKPSIAVLPFIDVGSDPEKDHIAEGLTDDLITELSKVSGLFVIARHSVFALKNRGRNIRDVAAELGVHFVLEGTLQRTESRLRINVTLIDALTGLSMWAERYDREYADIFAVQDDVIDRIIAALSVELKEEERTLLAKIPTENLEAYDYYLRAEHEGVLYGDVETYRRTLAHYQRAIDLDPGFAAAHAGIARVAVDVWRNDYNQVWSAAVARKIAYDAAGQALKLDPENARALTVLALLQMVDGHAAEAVNSATRAVTVQPNDAEAFANLALVLAHTGSHDQAEAAIDKALRLDPTASPSFSLLAGVVLYVARQNDRAIPFLEAARDGLPVAEAAREFLASAYAHAGNFESADQEADRLLELFPASNLTYYSYLYDYWPPDDLRYHLDGLAEAGIPEWPLGFQPRQADRLAADELQALVDNKTWVGNNRNGSDFIQYYSNGGTTAYRTANTNISGDVRVSGDQLCERFDGYFLNHTACGYVYRNTTTEEPQKDYIHVTPQTIKFFSVEG
jgi:adenylate cyclase